MPRRYFNWKLAIVLVIGMVVLGVTAFGLRQWQRANRAEQGLVLGNKAYDEQRWEQAASNLGRYLAVEQNDVPALLKYAEAQLKIRPSKRNSVQQAIAAYRAVLRADPNSFEAAIRLTEVYLEVGMPGEAELIATRQLDTNDDPELRRMLALALARQRKFNEAAAQLKAIIQKHPDQILAYETLGQLTEQRPEDFTDPNNWYNEAVNNNPSSALAYIVRAGFHRRAKGRAKALADLEQAEKLVLSDPMPDPNVELGLAGEFINADILDKAEQHLTAVQETMPKDQRLWGMWAQLAQRLQSQEKMLYVAETGLKELSSGPWDFMPIATELFISCGKLDRAADCISEMNQKDISPVDVAFLEGLVANERGHLFEAVKNWQQSMGLGMGNNQWMINKSPRVRLLLSSALSRLGNTQSALEHLRTLVSERPELFAGHLALARLLAQTGNSKEAVKHAETAKRLSQGNPDAVLLYLQARIQLLPADSTGENAQEWQDIETQLSALEESTDGALGVKLLQFQLARQKGNFTEAEASVTQLKKDHPLEIRVAMAEAELLAVQEKVPEAISILNRTIEEFPQTVEPVRYIAILLNQQGDKEKCEAILKDALARIDQPVAQRTLGLWLAYYYTQWKQKDDAYPMLNALAEKLPDDIPVKRLLLQCEQVIKDPEKAQQLIDDIKLLEGEDGWQWRYEQARIWSVADDFKVRYPQIVSLLQENLQANPNDQESRKLLAGAYHGSGELQLAISTYREILNRSPDDLRVTDALAVALFQAKKDDEADRLLEQASQRKPDSPQLQQLRLQSYLRREELGSASDVLEDFLSNDPNNQSARLAFAQLKTRRGQFDEAEELLDELKIQDPNSLPVAVAQIHLNISQKEPAEALRLCDELVSNLDNASAYILRARTYVSLGQADKVIEDFEQAAAIEPNNAGVWMAWSDFYSSSGQTDKALADIEQALSLDPNNVQIQKRAIPLLVASGDAEKVRQGKAILDEALQSNRDDFDLLLFKAKSLLTEGTAPAIKEATGILQKITEDRPETSQAWVLLGNIALSQGQLSKAMDTALRGLAHTPSDRALLLLKARAEELRSPVLAIPTYKMLLEPDPNNTYNTLLLANTYIAADQPQKAVNLLRTHLVSRVGTPDERRINIALAVALHKSGNKVEAQKGFDSLFQSEPNDPGLLITQVLLHKDDQLWTELSQKVAEWYQKHPKDSLTPIIVARNLMATNDSQAVKTAEDILRKVLENDSDSVEAMTTLAILLQTAGRSDKSAQLYEKVLELQPDNLIVINNLAWIMCEEQAKFQEALELAQQGLQISPDYIDLIDTRGVAYYRLGEFELAKEDFTKCITLYQDNNPAVVSSHFHLARAFDKLGEKNEAIKHLNQALDMNSQIGGLSASDLAEARRLRKQLQEGS